VILLDTHRTAFKLSLAPAGPTRLASFPGPPGWDALVALVAQLFQIPLEHGRLALTYLDADGDNVLVSSDDELHLRYKDAPADTPLRFTVHLSPPACPTSRAESKHEDQGQHMGAIGPSHDDNDPAPFPFGISHGHGFASYGHRGESEVRSGRHGGGRGGRRGGHRERGGRRGDGRSRRVPHDHDDHDAWHPEQHIHHGQSPLPPQPGLDFDLFAFGSVPPPPEAHFDVLAMPGVPPPPPYFDLQWTSFVHGPGSHGSRHGGRSCGRAHGRDGPFGRSVHGHADGHGVPFGHGRRGHRGGGGRRRRDNRSSSTSDSSSGSSSSSSSSESGSDEEKDSSRSDGGVGEDRKRNRSRRRGQERRDRRHSHGRGGRSPHRRSPGEEPVSGDMHANDVTGDGDHGGMPGERRGGGRHAHHAHGEHNHRHHEHLHRRDDHVRRHDDHVSRHDDHVRRHVEHMHWHGARLLHHGEHMRAQSGMRGGRGRHVFWGGPPPPAAPDGGRDGATAEEEAATSFVTSAGPGDGDVQMRAEVESLSTSESSLAPGEELGYEVVAAADI
jgi:hypothetical protein